MDALLRPLRVLGSSVAAHPPAALATRPPVAGVSPLLWLTVFHNL